MSNQAKKGGELGLNSEFYKGGQFLPSSEKTVKGQIKIKRGTKRCIAPFVYEKAPADNMLSLYERLSWSTRDNRKDCQYVKSSGFVGFKLSINRESFLHNSYGPCELDQNRFDWTLAMIERFNAGERWINIMEDPYHYLHPDFGKN